MALGRLDIPAARPLHRLDRARASSAAGTSRSPTSTRASARTRPARSSRRRPARARESVACPGAGACGGQFTANTMSTILEFLGISPPGAERDPGAVAEEGGGRVRVRPARRRSRRARRPPVADRHARGARERRRLGRRDRRLDERRPPSARDRPRVRDPVHDRRLRRDRGAHAGDRRHEAVGPLPRDRRLPRRRRRARRARARRSASWCTPARRPSTGRRSARSPTAVVETEGQEVIAPIEAPLKPTRRAAILRGNLAPGRLRGQARRPRPPLPPRPGARVRHRGGVLRRGEGGRDQAGRRRRDPLRGPARRPGHARDAPRHRGDRRRGPRRRGRAGHRRPLLRRDARVHGRPRRPRGLHAAARSRPSARATWSSSTSTASELRVELSDDEIAARLADTVVPPTPRYTTGRARASTRRMVSSASEGAVTRPFD